MKNASVKKLTVVFGVSLIAFAACNSQIDCNGPLEATPTFDPSKETNAKTPPAQISPEEGRLILSNAIVETQPAFEASYQFSCSSLGHKLDVLSHQYEQYRIELRRAERLPSPFSMPSFSGEAKRSGLYAAMGHIKEDMNRLQSQLEKLKGKKNIAMLTAAWMRLNENQRSLVLQSGCLTEAETTELLNVNNAK